MHMHTDKQQLKLYCMVLCRGTPKSNIPAEAFASTDTLGMVDNEIYKSRSAASIPYRGGLFI